MEKKGPLRVVCGIIERDGLILLGRRSEGQTLAGFWELPGGKIEPGEGPEEALKRELREELSIEVEVLKRIGSTFCEWKDRGLSLEAWHVSLLSGTPQLQVHDELVWVRPLQALEYPLAPADIPLIKNFLYIGPNES